MIEFQAYVIFSEPRIDIQVQQDKLIKHVPSTENRKMLFYDEPANTAWAYYIHALSEIPVEVLTPVYYC